MLKEEFSQNDLFKFLGHKIWDVLFEFRKRKKLKSVAGVERESQHDERISAFTRIHVHHDDFRCQL
jgi:hypothetical protein